jgi:hypothetical protein
MNFFQATMIESPKHIIPIEMSTTPSLGGPGKVEQK